jgi:putative phosphoribosyl transferase
MMMQEWFSEGFPVQVPAGTSILDAEMQVPSGASGLIVLAHAGRPRYAQRVQNLAEYFTKDGFGILIMDLLTEEESEIEKTDEGAFDIDLLSDRLENSLEWVRDLPEASGLPLGLFGTGMGAGAVFAAAAARPREVDAVAAAGIVPPVDFRILRRVQAPTLLVSGDDAADAELARACLGALTGRKRMESIPGYTRNREDARITEKVSRLATRWFGEYLV